MRLEELRLAAIEAQCNARLALGEHAAVVADLERLTREHPYREELRALQMLALYRSGRQADALRAFQATREVLAEELGIDPSPRLRRLEEQILLQDPDLDPSQPASAPSPSRRPVGEPIHGAAGLSRGGRSAVLRAGPARRHPGARVDHGAVFTAVVGPSGSGKSSAVQAGLIPRLRRDAPHVRIATMQPGAQPFAELEAALSRCPVRAAAPRSRGCEHPRAASSKRCSCSSGTRPGRCCSSSTSSRSSSPSWSPTRRRRSSAPSCTPPQDPAQRVHVLVTMRADFYDRPLADPRLGALFAENVVNVIPLGPDELEAAATMPARQLDVMVEPRLLGRLIVDVAGQPNALPLFQYALTELFDERAGPVLDLATYERIGGVRKAVARRAESIYTHLDGPEQQAVRQLFLRIATVSGEAVGRRRVPASELAALDVDIVALQGAIDAFTRYRLLALDRDPTTGSPTVEVAHEALLAEWHRLRDWIEESRDDLTTHARLVVALNEWESAGATLATSSAGRGWTATRPGPRPRRMQLTQSETEFLEVSVRLQEAEGEEKHARARRGHNGCAGGRGGSSSPCSRRSPCSPASSPTRSSSVTDRAGRIAHRA